MRHLLVFAVAVCCCIAPGSGIHAQTRNNCATCSERMTAAIEADPLCARAKRGELRTNADNYAAQARMIEIALTTCGECLSADEKTAMNQALAAVRETIRTLRENAVEVNDRDTENVPQTSPQEEPANNNTDDDELPPLEPGEVYRAR